ncbi:MAG: hypothetical protein ICV83_24800 [Cytophagales bacterium]|nr:hypothetical protein [Cytophagales bacterium]
MKAICETNSLEIAYGFSEGFHRIDVSLAAREPLPGHAPRSAGQVQARQVEALRRA